MVCSSIFMGSRVKTVMDGVKYSGVTSVCFLDQAADIFGAEDLLEVRSVRVPELFRGDTTLVAAGH